MMRLQTHRSVAFQCDVGRDVRFETFEKKSSRERIWSGICLALVVIHPESQEPKELCR